MKNKILKYALIGFSVVCMILAFVLAYMTLEVSMMGVTHATQCSFGDLLEIDKAYGIITFIGTVSAAAMLVLALLFALLSDLKIIKNQNIQKLFAIFSVIGAVICLVGTIWMLIDYNSNDVLSSLYTCKIGFAPIAAICGSALIAISTCLSCKKGKKAKKK